MRWPPQFTLLASAAISFGMVARLLAVTAGGLVAWYASVAWFLVRHEGVGDVNAWVIRPTAVGAFLGLAASALYRGGV